MDSIQRRLYSGGFTRRLWIFYRGLVSWGFWVTSRRAFEAGLRRSCGSLRLITSAASLGSDERRTPVTRFLRVTEAPCPRGKWFALTGLTRGMLWPSLKHSLR